MTYASSTSLSRRQSLAAVSLGLLGSGNATLLAAERALTQVRVCISDRVVSGVNINDARASLKLWSREIIANSELNISGELEMILPSGQLLSAIRTGSVDLMCLTIDEYMQVRDFVDLSTIVLQESAGDILVLVVHGERSINSLADLRGRSLQILDAANTSLAVPWLAVSLHREGLPAPAQFVSRLTRKAKLAQVVLPVYFGQIDACVVTRQGLDTMSELNPQLSKTLKIVRASPTMYSTIFACRRGLTPQFRKQILERIVAAKTSPAAKQLLTLFHSPGYTFGDATSLRPAVQLLEAYHRLPGSTGSAGR